MSLGYNHVDVPVTQAGKRAEQFSRDTCPSGSKARDGYVDIDTGTLTLRLMIKTGRVEHPDHLAHPVADVEGLTKELCKAGARLRYAPLRTPEQELFGAGDRQRWPHPDAVARALGGRVCYVPELAKSCPGHRRQRELSSLLKSVPALFRALVARRQNAELLAESSRVVGARAGDPRSSCGPLQSHALSCASHLSITASTASTSTPPTSMPTERLVVPD